MNFLEIASYLGTIAFAISGVIIGIRKNLDIMGVFILAFLTSSGGGVLRDMLLNKSPAIFGDAYVFPILIIIVLVFKILRVQNKINKLEGTFIFRMSDSIGLVAFAITGGTAAVIIGSNMFITVVLAFLTAVGGGITRDILVNEVPEILKSGFYGSVAVIVGFLIYVFDAIGIAENIAIPIIFIFGILIRYLAIYKNYQLPKM